MPEERIGYSSGWTVDEDPVDPDSRRVVADGMRVLHDPDGRLAALATAATRDRP